MVSSKTSKTITFAISLLVAVISLTGAAMAAIAPNVTFSLTNGRYTPGFAGAPGKMATDNAGNLYVADFWAKGIVKLNYKGDRIGFIPTASRPAAVAVMSDNRLVVAMSTPQAYVAFYVQSGYAPNVTGSEVAQFGAADTLYRPVGIAVDTHVANGNIFVLDAGNSGVPTTDKPIKVYSATGAFQTSYASRTGLGGNPGATGDLKLPLGIAYEKDNDQIVVADSGNNRLQFYSAATGTFVKSIGSALQVGKGAGTEVQTVGALVKFGDPADVVFDHDTNATPNLRIYVADRSRNRVLVVDPVSKIDLKHIPDGIAGADILAPASLLFRPATTGGMLFVGSAASSTGNNVVAFGIDGGSVPTQTVALAINPSSVPPTTTTGQSPLTVSGTVSPVNAVNCSVNGGADTLATPSGSTWNAVLTLQPNYNYILCKATSGGVTTYAEASTYYTGAPATGPVLAITSPATGIYTNNTTVVVSGTTDVAGANIRVSNALNGAVASTTSGADKAWSASIALEEGSNAITVSAWKSGTTVYTASVTVNADYTAPDITNNGKISFLANNATTVNAIQNLDGIVVEKNLSSIVVNGNVVSTKVALPAANNDKTYFSMPVTLVRGTNTITVTATDLAGNQSVVVTRTVTLNPEIPGLTVDLPADNSYATGAGTATANGAVDAIFTSVDACGAAVNPSGGLWSTTTMPVGAGFNSCQFTASAGVGITAVTEKRSINADATYAQLAITDPPADLATKNASVIITGKVAPSSPAPEAVVNSGARVTIGTTGNGSYDSVTGTFSYPVTLGVDGSTTTVKVFANGATVAAIRNIIHDATVPSIGIQANANAAPSLITGTLDDPSAKLTGITALISGVQTSLPLSLVTFDSYSDKSVGDVVWHANLAGYGYSAVKFTTADPAGNTAEHSFISGIPTGDVDGDGVVRLSDALAALRHVAGTETLAGSPLDNTSPRFKADVGALIDSRAAQDGVVTIEDAVLILRKAYGLLTF